MARLIATIAAVSVLAVAGVTIGGLEAEACGSTNSADLENHGEVTLDIRRHFEFSLEAEWHMVTNPAWVVLQLIPIGGDNVENVVYTPQYLQNQDCDDSYIFGCEGDLEGDGDGTVTTRLDVGISPNHAYDIENTHIEGD